MFLQGIQISRTCMVSVRESRLCTLPQPQSHLDELCTLPLLQSPAMSSLNPNLRAFKTKNRGCHGSVVPHSWIFRDGGCGLFRINSPVDSLKEMIEVQCVGVLVLHFCESGARACGNLLKPNFWSIGDEEWEFKKFALALNTCLFIFLRKRVGMKRKKLLEFQEFRVSWVP